MKVIGIAWKIGSDATASGAQVFDSLVASYTTSAKKENAYIGAWVDNGRAYLDLSQIVPDKDKAIELGKVRNQKAIFSFETFESVYLS